MRIILPNKLRHALGATAVVLAFAAGPALAQAPFSASNNGFTGSVSAASARQGSPIYAGETAVITGRDMIAGQSITLMRGPHVLNADTPIVVDTEGKFSFEIAIEAEAPTGLHPVVVIAEGPAAAEVIDLKISPKIALSGAERFDITSEKVTRGLYQVAFSPKSNALFVTSAVGRPPVKEATLSKIDPATLQVIAQITPELAPATRPGQEPSLFAPYGIGVDDGNDTIWITNTRQNTVAVYKQSDLSLVKQFDPNTADHARDVVIDQKGGRAYVSSALSGDIHVFDATTLEKLEVITIASQLRGKTFATMSLALDPAARKLITASYQTSEAAVIDLDSHQARVVPVPGLLSGSGAAYDPVEDLLFLTGQASDNLIIAKASDGTVLHNVATGAGALNVFFEPKSRLAFVTNRSAGTLTVVDTKGQIVANIDGGTLPNHLISDGNGTIWAVTSGRGEDDPNGNRILRILPKAP